MLFHPEWNQYVSHTFIISTLAAYPFIVFSLKRAMVGRDAFSLKPLLRLFNVVQIALSVVMCYELSGTISIFDPFMLKGEFTAHTERWLFIHYLAKFWDLFETGFIVLRKRDSQLTTLHMFHHSSILFIWGELLHVGLANGTAAYGAFVNSFVHAVMYVHLYSKHSDHGKCTVALNKSSVVLCQVTQFLSCMVHALFAMAFDDMIPTGVCFVQLFYNVLLVYLFIQESRSARRRQAIIQKQQRAILEEGIATYLNAKRRATVAGPASG